MIFAVYLASPSVLVFLLASLCILVDLPHDIRRVFDISACICYYLAALSVLVYLPCDIRGVLGITACTCFSLGITVCTCRSPW